MKNKQNITVENLEIIYQGVVCDTANIITNISNPTTDPYAHKSQQLLSEQIAYQNSKKNKKDTVLISTKLSEIICPLVDSLISYYTDKNSNYLHQFELSFMIYQNNIGYPVVLRNGYLLKCLKEAGIKTFEELDEYKAVLIYNNADVNAHICSFVKFNKI